MGENASDALKMAAAILLFVMALSVAIFAFSKARYSAEKAMENLSGTSFSQTDFSTAVDLFQSQSRMNSAGTYNASYYTKGDPSNGSLLQQFYPLRR